MKRALLISALLLPIAATAQAPNLAPSITEAIQRKIGQLEMENMAMSVQLIAESKRRADLETWISNN